MFDLYPFQSDALRTVEQRLGENHRPIVSAYCGSGKTVLAAHIAKQAIDKEQRVLWMTGREEIIRQAYRTFTTVCGRQNVGVLCAGLAHELPWWSYPKVTIASWDTLKARWSKSDIWHIPADVVMYDEAHLCLSKKMCETVIPHYQDKTVIGFTATPARKSGRGLGSFFTRIIQVKRVQDLIDDGYLAAPEYWSAHFADVSKCSVDAKTGDFNQKQLGELHRDDVLIGDVIDNWLRIAHDRHTIVFAVDIAHAQALAERFQKVGISAAAIYSGMTHETRADISEQFRNQDLQVLVNVGIATYGYDVPEINAVVTARPTKSIVLWHQMCGRGLRPKADNDHCKILDHGGNIRRLGCIEDEIRWRLDEGREAATNTTREGDPTRNKGPEAPPTECGSCGHVFKQSRVCPKCGWEKPAPSRDIETIDADLVKVRKARSTELALELEEAAWFRMFKWVRIDRSKKPGWEFFLWERKFKKKAPPEWWSLTPLEATDRVVNFVQSQNIRFAKSRKKPTREERV